MRKVLLIIILFLIIGNKVFAQNVAISNGLDYLSNTQNSNGAWNGNTTTDFYSTFTVLETLRIFNRVDASYQIGFQWCQSQPINNVDYFAKRIMLFSQNNISSTSELSALLSLRDSYSGGWGLKEPFISDILDTALVLQALKAANYSDSNTISTALGYLTSTQNPDGGFGFYAGDDSNVYMTAVAAKTLMEYKGSYNLQASINNAVSYLLTKQNPDGGFGASSSTVYETALVYQILVRTIYDPIAWAKAEGYLLNTQNTDGSWGPSAGSGQDAYSTALKKTLDKNGGGGSI
jgi:squalene cyclase